MREYTVDRERLEWEVDDSKQKARLAEVGNQRVAGYQGPEL